MDKASYFIGLDDTDSDDSIGTGALARELMVLCKRDLDAQSLGITRHQFLIHPDIPYTSHNSGACLEMRCGIDLETLAKKCRGFLRFLFHPGADPGLCITRIDQLSDDLLSLARRAQTEIVSKEEAMTLANDSGILLEEHGGTGLGVIGALCGCALRMNGNDGRFISHMGIRNVESKMTVKQLKERTAVQMVVDKQGTGIDDACVVLTNNWVRPDLKNGRIVQHVQSGSEPGTFFIEKKKKGQDDM